MIIGQKSKKKKKWNSTEDWSKASLYKTQRHIFTYILKEFSGNKICSNVSDTEAKFSI